MVSRQAVMASLSLRQTSVRSIPTPVHLCPCESDSDHSILYSLGVSFLALFCPIFLSSPCLALSCLVFSYHVLSCLFLSYLVLSYVVFTFNATGRFGVMTCYESWFPETARLLGYKGAEVVLFPSAGCARIRFI
jgi:hypothetical protein